MTINDLLHYVNEHKIKLDAKIKIVQFNKNGFDEYDLKIEGYSEPYRDNGNILLKKNSN